MKIHCLTQTPPPELANALAAFEQEFRYPLGPADSFSISHGEDYTRFFRSMGEARVYLAELNGVIIGALASINRHVRMADGTSLPAVYLCDAKVVEKHRSKMVLGRLVMAARDQILASGNKAAFSVVMHGSIPTDQHTGRLGIPKFDELGKLAILRFDTRATLHDISLTDQCNELCHRPYGGDPDLTSEITSQTLSVDGASGILLDTRRGKRLWKNDGTELASLHLTALHFTSASALFHLIQTAIAKSSELGYPGLFTALPASHPMVHPLLDASGGTATLAGASVYGTALPEGHWMINTSEI